MAESPLERLILGLDGALRTLGGVSQARRDYPATEAHAEVEDAADSRHAAGLMRVNHAGEVCAQALYRGQALTARGEVVRASLQAAARDEEDHLAWCEQRLAELGERPSVLNPLWYAGSFAVGALTGLLGDRTSLGFVAATEEKVVEHLERHEQALPVADQRSREVVAHMKADEQRHGQEALAGGGQALPAPVKELMALLARVMTTTSYRI